MSYDFVRTHVRAMNPDTSREAAASVEMMVGPLKKRILTAMQRVNVDEGWTVTELARYLELQEIQVNKRLSDLKNDGLIEASDVVRVGASGRHQTAWKITGY